jgi:hypothetical protein
MNDSHPHHEALLRYAYELLDEAQMAAIREHLAGCAPCARSLRQTASFEDELPSPEAPPPSTLPAVIRLWRSVAAPLLLMLLTVTLATLLDGESMAATITALAIGGLTVVVWLHAMVSRAERAWRELTSGDRDALNLDDHQETLLMTGAILSWNESLRRSRRQITLVVVTAALLAVCSAATLSALSLAFPHQTTAALSQRADLLPGALTVGALLAGGLWANLRLLRLARRAGRWVTAA